MFNRGHGEFLGFYLAGFVLGHQEIKRHANNSSINLRDTAFYCLMLHALRFPGNLGHRMHMVAVALGMLVGSLTAWALGDAASPSEGMRHRP